VTGAAGYLLALTFTAIAVGLRFALDPWLGNVQHLLTLYAAVAGTVWLAGWKPAVVSTIAGYLAMNYFFIEPRYHFIVNAQAVASALGGAFSCAVIIWLAEEEARARQLAFDREQEAEKVLSRHQRLAAIVESSTDAIISVDMDGVITTWNRGAELLYGYSATEMEGKSIDVIVPKDRAAEEQQILNQIRSGHTVDHYETQRRRKDGTLVPVALTVSAIRDAQGKVIGASKNARDITQRKVSEDALQRSETTLRTALDAGELGAWEWDIPRNRVTWTDRIYEFHGVTRDQFDGTVEGFSKLVHPEDLPKVRDALQRALEQRAPYRLEFRAVRPNGEIRWLVTGAHVFRNEHGQPERMVGVTQDFTARLKVEEALRESESRFRQLAESMPQLVWTASSDGKVDYYNQRIHDYFGAVQDPAGNWSWQPMVHPDDLEATSKAWREAVAGNQPYSAIHRVRVKNGLYRWHLSRALPVRDSRNQVVKWFGTATDIDDQKRAEERLESVVAQRTAKLRETVSELEGFSYSIAHDMRAPLRSMAGYASILLSDYSNALDAEAQNFLRRIETSAERLDRLIQDVLDYSKIVRAEMDLEPVDFAALAEDIIFSYSHLQEPHATIVLERPLPIVQANQAALTQVIANLLGNAVKFVPPGTKPRIVLRSEPAQDGFVRIWFEDNGIGIDSDAQQRIFQIFQRLHRLDQYDGTGIGLSIVRKAAERMGGRVGVESAPGQGSRFWVELKESRKAA
jgi:PAS domain S-box-containing protein